MESKPSPLPLDRQEKQGVCLWKRTLLPRWSLFKKENSCIHITGCKFLAQHQVKKNGGQRWWMAGCGQDAQTRLHLQDTCSLHAPWVTSGLLCHRGVHRGLCALYVDPLALQMAGVFSQGPRKSLSTWWCQTGENPSHSPLPPSAGHSFTCGMKGDKSATFVYWAFSTNRESSGPGSGEAGTQGSGGESKRPDPTLRSEECERGLMEVLVNTVQDVRASGPHSEAWRKAFSDKTRKPDLLQRVLCKHMQHTTPRGCATWNRFQ